jgi:hypothetical protein
MTKTSPKIFSVSQYHQGFQKVSPIESSLTLTAAESLMIQLNENSDDKQDHFIYSPQLDLTGENKPSFGHAVEIVTGYYVKGMGIISRSIEKGEFGITLSPDAWCNPRSILDGEVILSISGGPSPFLPTANMTRKGNIYQRLWHYRNERLTRGCAINYFVNVPLWEYNGIEE